MTEQFEGAGITFDYHTWPIWLRFFVIPIPLLIMAFLFGNWIGKSVPLFVCGDNIKCLKSFER